MILLVVAAALVDPAGRVLIAKRPEGKHMAGLWEFPGGKIEPGETPEGAMVRELHEELGIIVRETDLEPLSFVSHGYDGFHLLMPTFLCRRWEGTPRPLDAPEIAFVAASELDRWPMPDADAPLRKSLRTTLGT